MQDQAPPVQGGTQACKTCRELTKTCSPYIIITPRKSSIEWRGGAREVGADEVPAALTDWYTIYQIRVGRYKGDPNSNLDMNS